MIGLPIRKRDDQNENRPERKNVEYFLVPPIVLKMRLNSVENSISFQTTVCGLVMRHESYPPKELKKSRDILTMNFYTKNSNKIFSWCI